MKKYNSKDQINEELKRLTLERQIAWEEIKGLRYELKEDLEPYNWVNTAISALKKYGLLYMIRKLFR